MSYNLRFFVFILLFASIFPSTLSFAQSVDTAWIRRYNGPGDSLDVAWAMAVDNSGNVYVTGESWGSGTGSDYTTIKYVQFLSNFSGSPRSGYKHLLVQFTDSSTGGPTSWLWDFGDGDTDTVQNPMHTYNDTGYFDVKLVVSDSVHSDTIIKPNYIAVFETLTVDFTAESTQGRKPLTVSFQSIFNATPDSVTWYFGDGDSSNELNPVHQYTADGTYDVKLVAELFGYKDSLTKEDYIWVSDIKAEFAADKRCGSAPLTVMFSDSSTGTYPITDWYWDFGDGNTSDQQNPTHQFTNTGVFDITLIVSDGIADDTLTKKDYITTQDSK